MADLGLPLAFGKQTLPTRPDVPSSSTSNSASASASASTSASVPRGGPAGRGPRGVVGGGKRGRGRGRGGAAAAAAGGGGDGVSDVSLGEEGPPFNSGVKRPHNPTNFSQTQPPPQSSYNHNRNHHSQTPPRGSFGGRGGPSNRGWSRGPDGGGRGRGASHSSGGGARGHGETTSEAGQKGFYKPSFVEDPWAELMEKRERRLAGRG